MPASARLSALALAAAVSTSPACIDIVATDGSWIVEHEEKRFSVTGIPEVSVSTFDGPIEIRTWDREEVEVAIEKRAADSATMSNIVVTARQDGNRVSVDVKNTRSSDGIFDMRWTRASLVVSVPRSSNIQAHSHDGSITLERLAGRIDLRSGDGSIRARDVSGEITAHTGDGSMRFDGVDGVLDAQSGDGSVVVDGALDGLRVRTGDGSVSIYATEAARSRDWEVTTGDGSVILEVPEGFGGELEAHTGDGRIRVEGLSVSTGEDRRRRDVRGTIGAGGPSVRLRTGDGSISVRSR